MHLLDTELVWALRHRADREGTGGPVAWAASLPRTGLFVSALSIAELGAGAARLARRDKAAAAAVRRWLETQVTAAFDGRVLPVDGAVARRATTLALPGLRDALVAATALEHGLTIATRDAAAFKGARVKLADPWRYNPDQGDEIGDWRDATRAAPVWLRNLFVR